MKRFCLATKFEVGQLPGFHDAVDEQDERLEKAHLPTGLESPADTDMKPTGIPSQGFQVELPGGEIGNSPGFSPEGRRQQIGGT